MQPGCAMHTLNITAVNYLAGTRFASSRGNLQQSLLSRSSRIGQIVKLKSWNSSGLHRAGPSNLASFSNATQSVLLDLSAKSATHLQVGKCSSYGQSLAQPDVRIQKLTRWTCVVLCVFSSSFLVHVQRSLLNAVHCSSLCDSLTHSNGQPEPHKTAPLFSFRFDRAFIF